MSIQIKVLTILVSFSLASIAFSVNAKQTNPAGTKSKTISDLACADGEIAKFNQTNNIWECATDEIGSSSGSPQFVVKDAQGDQFGDVLFTDSIRATIDVVLAGKRLLVTVTQGGASILSGREVGPITEFESCDGLRSDACYTTSDCSDEWWRASLFTTTNYLLTGIDFVFIRNPLSGGTNIVEPTGTPQNVNLLYEFDITGQCTISPTPRLVEVYSGIAVVASDIFADFPAPYTLEVQ